MATKKPGATFRAAQHEKNKTRNRYADILPYDDTRVRLRDEENDFINANHLTSTVSGVQHWYIACQGPLKQTTNHFWKMVWQEKSKIVVMVAAEVENGMVKCERYWPEKEGEEVLYGEISVTVTRARSNGNYTIRGLKLENHATKEKRSLWHMQYFSWPDHGVPSIPSFFLAFVDEIRAARGRLGINQAVAPWPIIIHCSAGIGRTGVLITIELVLAKADAGLIPDVKATLEELREQRCNLIQTPDQYNFVYCSLVQALENANDNEQQDENV
jgi:protein tyrosine phosphatase